MRISDWSSDVCSSDLLLTREVEKVHYLSRRREFEAHMDYEGDELDLLGFYLDNGFNIGDTEYSQDIVLNMALKSKELDGSEKRRVGKECVCTCRSRWSLYH